jgi:hypothetical protein
MKQYSDFVDRIFSDRDLLKKLLPAGLSDTDRLLRIRAADDAAIGGEKTITSPEMFALVRAGLFYAVDAIDEGHKIVQGIGGDESSYWHGMVHRREGDFDNARYWYRRSGELPVFGELHREAAAVSAVVAAQSNWDPYLFTGLCEQNKFGETETRDELVKLQRIEFDVIFDYCWRRSFKA